jgi:tripartite-type tricarboxylate transporter receptor subunit TctC
LQDLLAGQIAASVAVTSSALAAIRTGQARALVTTAPKRGVSLPDLPTISQAGYPALESVEWFGLLAPRDTPATLVAALNTSTREALGTARVRDAIANLSMEVAPSTPDELARLITADSAGWGKIVETSGFKPLD